MKLLKSGVISKSRSGMTLLEIVVSLAIFAIMSVGFYGVFATVFVNMYHTSRVTENVFESQQVIEERIADVKLKLKNGLVSEVTDTRETHVLFSGSNQRTVYAYHLTETMINGRRIETLIAENRPPQLEVPIIEGGVVIGAKLGSNPIKYPNIASRENLSIGLSEDITVNNEGILIQYLYYWYKSKPGYYTLSDPPQFPNDYEVLAGYTSKDILTIPQSFGGSFFKLLVTPVGEKGAMGTSVESNALFISPLPVYSSLLLHYDASLINKANPIEFENNRVKQWFDMGPLGHPSASAATNINNRPGISSYVYGEETQKHTFGVKSETSGTQTLTSNVLNAISRQNVTVYLVVNFNSLNGAGNNILLLHSRSSNTSNRNKFVLKTSSVSGYQGQLELIRYSNNGTQFSVINESNYRTDRWEIIKLEVYSSGLSIRSEITKIDDDFSFLSSKTGVSTPNPITLTPFRLSFEYGYAIGEVLVYDDITTTSDEQLILEYLYNKYRP